MCSRDLLTRRGESVTPRRGGDIPQQRFWVFYLGLTRDVVETLGVSFKTCLRCRGDVMMERRCYVLLRRRYGVPIRCRGDAPLRRLGDVPSRRRWVFHLRRTCDVNGTYRETSLRRHHDILMPDGMIADRTAIFDLQIEELSADLRTIEADWRTIFDRRTIFADQRTILDLQIEELSADGRSICRMKNYL